MLPTPLRVLILEDRPADAELMLRELRHAGFEPVWQRVETEAAYVAHLRPSLDIILADYNLPQFDALRAFHLLQERQLDIPFIIVSGVVGEDVAMECVTQGAADYLHKDRLARLGRAVARALQDKERRDEKRSGDGALRESEDRYRSLFERVPVGLYRTTPAGEIVNANPALVQMLGYPDRESLLQLNARDVYVDPEDRKRQVDVAEREGVVRDFEMQLRRCDGTAIWVWDTMRIVTDGEGRASYYDGAMEDVTERKRAEEARQKLEAQLQQAQKLEAVGLLAGGIAHDFNNRLTVILGNAQLALGALNPSDASYELLISIEGAAKGAAALTRQLLTLSRRQILQPELLDLNKLITDFAQMLGRIISEAIELQLDLAPGAAGVCADSNALEQVLMNLALNARDAMPGGGTLRMATATVQVDEAYCRVHPQAKAGDYVRLTVADTGVGMDETVKGRLFEPFFTTKEPGKGTGLGLCTVYGIVRQHDGWIEVESAVGEGTTFRIFLPVAQKSVHEAPQREEAVAIRMVEKTILLAEDEQAVQEVEQRMLEQLGYKVLVAVDGEQAVEVFAANQKNVDLVILDAVMPKLSGPKAYASIRALRMDVPVLFVTGHSENLACLPLQSRSSPHLLTKPFGPRELAQKVGEALEEAAWTSPAQNAGRRSPWGATPGLCPGAKETQRGSTSPAKNAGRSTSVVAGGHG